MKNVKFFKQVFFSGIILLFLSLQLYPQARQMERLDRGLVSVREGTTNYVSWRLLGDEARDKGFNLYRDGVKINSSPITGATFYADNAGGSYSSYTLRGVVNGSEEYPSSPSIRVSGSYYSVPLQVPGPNHASDASVGDLDGDGVYEIILKWEADNSKDNSQSGVTDPVYLDAIKLDGTRMWRINLGRNIRAGAHYTQFMVYDLDGDGKAEVACKTADGTIDGQGRVIGNPNADWRNSSGYILSGPEYLTVFDGETGAALATQGYVPARGNVSAWGDDYGNRVDRFLAAVAYLDGSRPSLVMCRGYYTRTVLAAWDFRNGSLTSRWVFDSDQGYSSYAGQGYHSLSVADVDEDGYDEIIYGSMTVDHNGRGLWNSRLGHGDALHVTDIDPGRPGLEVWGIHEKANIGSALLDARTGQIIWNTGAGDVGRGVAADLTSSFSGLECWGGTSGLRSADNRSAGSSPASSNHVIWWDGDLQRELLDGITITKYGGDTLLSASGCSSNNGTKSNPCLQVDLWGDWREEVIFRSSNSQELRIYTTTTSTNYRLYTLMHDSVYRTAIAWQNVGYNQPPHPGFYLGGGMTQDPQPSLYYPNTGPTPTPSPSPTPTPSPTPALPGSYVLQAEDAFYPNGVVESDHTGFSGSGYVNTENAQGAYVEWTVNVSTQSDAVCRFVFANGGNDRPMSLLVNDVPLVASLAFASSGDWASWDSEETQITLSSGINYIRLVSLSAEGAPNLDRLDLTINSNGEEKGDVNGSGTIDIVDALMTAQYYVGSTVSGFIPSRGDVNCDGKIDIIDALIIAQYYVGLVQSFC